MTQDHSFEIGLVGNAACEHGAWTYYHSVTQDHSFEIGLVGNAACEHGAWTYYHSVFHEFDPYEGPDGEMVPPGNGIYAVCGACGWHRWNVTPADGAKVIDIDQVSDAKDYEADDAVERKT